ncbi:MAG TPA: exo-alpha-sialidase [Bacteroidia bacterium]|jgi:hypothetical protein
MRNFLPIVLLFCACSLAAQNNINISNYNFDDTEPYITVNPSNPNQLIAAWMKVTGVPQISIAVSYSSDGGITWSSPANMPSLHNSFRSADVSLAYTNTGTAYICYINYDQYMDSGYVMVAKTTDNGQTWSTPVKVTSALESPDLPIDRPWIAVDTSGGPYNGRLYVVSKSVDIGALPHHIWMKTSGDGGLTWSSRQQVDYPSTVGFITNSMGSIDVGPDGNVYIAYMSYDTAQSVLPRVLLKKSVDGGANFSQNVIAYPVSNSAITDSLYQGSYCLKVNPANANNLVFICTDARNGDPDILAVHSNNGGTSWNFTPARVNHDLQGNGAGQEMCWGGFSPNGVFAAVYRDRRNGGTSSSSNFEVYASLSLDGGNTFLNTDYKISSQQSPVIPIVKGNDFLGVALTNNYLFTDWCDKRTGNTEIFTARDTINTIISVKDIPAPPVFSLVIFPNPTTDRLFYTIHCENDYDDAEQEIYDVNGKFISGGCIGHLKEGENTMVLWNDRRQVLAPGTYFIKVTIAGNTVQKKFIVLKN